MAEMSTAQRLAFWAKFMCHPINSDVWSGLTKQDILAAVNAIDTALDNYQGAMNNWFPEPFKSNATTKQKAALLALVLLERYEVL